MKDKRPNIVIINPDEMRADTLSHLGYNAIETKNLDELAKEGASFGNAFCQNPVCVPSRCSFLTGWYPHVAGHRTMASMLGPGEPLLFRYLKKSGYYVWTSPRNDYLPAQQPGYYQDSADTWFLTEEMEEIVFEEKWKARKCREESGQKESFLGDTGENRRILDDVWVEGACRFLEERTEEEGKPFCLFLPLQLPHPPYQAPEKYIERVKKDQMKPRIQEPENFQGKCRMMKELHKRLEMGAWTEEMYEDTRVKYLAMCLQVDDYVGQIVKVLKNQGLYENTAIFVLSDHGDFAGDYSMVEKQQNSFEDCLVRVPFIVKLPGKIQKRKGVQRGLVELVDFYATVEALAGYKSEHTHFGHSLVDYLTGREEKRLRSEVFCEGGFRKGEKQCMLSEGNTAPPPSDKYYPRLSLQMDEEEMWNGKAIMCRTHEYKYVKRLYEKDELYDLKKDPQERCNAVDFPEYGEVLWDMQKRLLTHYLDTSDAVPFSLDVRQEPSLMAKVGKRMMDRIQQEKGEYK